MAKFLAIHTLPNPALMKELSSVGKAVNVLSNPDVQWIESWVQIDEENKVYRIYCKWEAKDKESVQKVLAKLSIPVDGVYPLAIVNPKDFK